jgi:hypothetical protein
MQEKLDLSGARSFQLFPASGPRLGTLQNDAETREGKIKLFHDEGSWELVEIPFATFEATFFS